MSSATHSMSRCNRTMNTASIPKSPAQIAAAIASELREHPERWVRFDTKCPWDAPEEPRCIVGLIQKQWTDARSDLSTLEAFAQFVPKMPSLDGIHRTARLATELFAWNDSYASVDDVIALCERVAQFGSHAEVAA